MEERTLCKRCAENYREAGFRLMVKEPHDTMAPCDICMRRGYDYLVERDGRDRE